MIRVSHIENKNIYYNKKSKTNYFKMFFEKAHLFFKYFKKKKINTYKSINTETGNPGILVEEKGKEAKKSDTFNI